MKKIFGLLVVLGIIAFAGKLYLENKYTRELKNVLVYASSVADIRFDKVKIETDGTIAVTNLIIRPNKIEDTFEIGTLSFKSSDPLFAIRGFKSFEKGEYPNFFEINMLDMSMGTGYLEDIKKKAGAKPCRDLFSTFNYESAGFNTLEGDFRFNIDFRDLYNSTMVVDAFDQTSSTRIDITFDASKIIELAQTQDQIPIINVGFEMSLESDAAESFVSDCADRFKIEPDAFLTKVVGSPKFSQNSFGYDLGPEFRTALVEFVRGGGAIEMKAKPADQIKNLTRISFYKPKDVIRFLNLIVLMDGEEIPISARLIEAEKKKEAVVDPNAGYEVTSFSKARSYIGKVVRIQRTGDRSQIIGRLSGVERGRLAVVRYHKRGPMTLTVGPEDIEKIEVRP